MRSPELFAALLALVLAGCAVPRRAGHAAPPRRVALPAELAALERQHLRLATEVLADFGFRPASGRRAEYALGFDIEEGPVNVDTTITLTRQGVEIVRATGRDGGPAIPGDRAGVVRGSVEEAVADFEDQVERLDR